LLVCYLPFHVQADKLDPREQAKQETREWVNDIVDRLTVRIEQFEYEMEEMQANLKKKAKPPPKLVQVRVRDRPQACSAAAFASGSCASALDHMRAVWVVTGSGKRRGRGGMLPITDACGCFPARSWRRL
jgi:hypothetical protein